MDKILKEDLASQTTKKETNLSDILSGQLEDGWNPEPNFSNSNSLNNNLALACTMLKLGLKFKNCQLQSSHGALKSKLARTGPFPEDKFSLHMRDKPEKPCGWWQLSKTGYNLAGPWSTELRLRWSTGHTAIQKFVWSSNVKSGWLGTRSLQAGGLGAGGDEEKVEGKSPGSGGNLL